MNKLLFNMKMYLFYIISKLFNPSVLNSFNKNTVII